MNFQDEDVIYYCRSQKELHKWITIIMLDAYQLHKEETEIMEAKEMNLPMVIQRLSILKDIVEEEYLEKDTPERKKGPIQKKF